MTKEEAALLSAIAREPDDDLHRLGYADWLTENGDPNRAELIRIQCGLERGVDWQNGGEAKGDRLKELQDRERELIQEMIAPIQQVSDTVFANFPPRSSPSSRPIPISFSPKAL